jgi:hypothetical protein
MKAGKEGGWKEIRDKKKLKTWRGGGILCGKDVKRGRRFLYNKTN